MSSCCDQKTCDMEKLSASQTKVLWLVLILNMTMFFVEISAGLVAGSLSLIGDSMDMLGDALAYGSSLYVLKLGQQAKARAAVLKAGIIGLSALLILGSSIYRAIYVQSPDFQMMGYIGFLALAVNVVCLKLLTRFKDDDINMSSVWLCSRNDIIANLSVLAAAFLVYQTSSPWPDLAIGIGLSILFLRSAFSIVKQAVLILEK